MVRTKKHFRPPSDDDSSSSSSDASSDEDNDNQQQLSSYGRGKQLGGNFGRGKQLGSMGAGRGKQLRAPAGLESDSSDGSSSDDDDDDEDNLPPSPSRGKQLRPTGRGKQLRAPSPPPAASAKDDTDSSAGVVVPRGGGKQLGRGMGKQLPRPTQPPVEEEESDSSSDDDEPWNAPPVQRGQGKQLPPPPATAAAAAEKEESDMEESSEEEEEEVVVKKPAPKAKAATKKAKAQPAKKKKKEPEPEPEEEESDDESDFEPEKKKPAPKRRGRPPARAAATRATRSAKAAAAKDEEESEEEESDSSSDEEQEWDMETFDTQKLVQGAKDKEYLDSLPEIERESILAERFEKLKSEADMKKALKENKRREREQKKSAGAQKKKPAKKRAAPAKAKKAPAKKKRVTKKAVETESEEDEEMDDTLADEALAKSLAGKRVSGRNLVKKGKQLKKQAALAKIRENRANKQQAALEESDSDLDYGKDSDDSDDDYEEQLKPWQQKGKKKPVPESSDDESMGIDEEEIQAQTSEKRTEDIEADLEDYQKVSIPRRRLMRWVSEPYFEKAVKNFYVRMGIGRDNQSQKSCYRLCKIVGVVTKSEYTFPSTENQKPISTDKWLQVAFGKNVRDFKMLTISDHRPNQEDVTRLVSQLKTERLTDDILTKKRGNKLRKRQDELVNNYTYTKDDIDMLVKEKKKRNKKSLNIGLEKTRVALAVQAAQDEVEEIKRRIEIEEQQLQTDDAPELTKDALEKEKEALEMANQKLEECITEQQRIQKVDEDRVNKLKQSSKVQNWTKVNRKAKMANRNADFQSYLEQQAREKMQGSAEPKFDPYARRRQKPKNLWEVGGPNQSSENVSEINGSSGAVEEEKKETTERDDANVGKEGGNGENKREEIPEQPQKLEMPGQTNKFAFDDDIMIGGDMTNLGIGTKKVETRSRKGLSLDDYQERKTAGTL